ncbi:MAG: hypothetical protein QOD55_1884 [Solirubrobacteraceae bacterium]|jgi:hypothetical protein|nr:hypothetical protein [Solirubrobacteraceae bacterium]MEA2289887.1 hypothetical protein [Solirubrobacteraceae bacterium]
MTAFAIRLPRRRQSKPAKVAKGAAKVWTTMKIGSIAGRTAKKGAKAYGSWKVAKVVARGGKKLLIVPLAAGGGLAAWKRLRAQRADGPATPYGSSVGPAAPSQSVTPPGPGPSAGLNGEGALKDQPAGATNPPVNPPPGATS